MDRRRHKPPWLTRMEEAQFKLKSRMMEDKFTRTHCGP